MARLGAVLLLLLVILMDAKSLWSGGVEWGTAVTARADAYWQDDGATPSGKRYPDVAIAGELVTAQVQSAEWSLGISGVLADLAPNTASVTLVGQITAVPGDDVVISTGWGVAWSGRLDSINETRDINGDYWTTVTATDRIGALGAATLVGFTFSYDDVEVLTESIGTEVGIPINVVDGSAGGLDPILSGPDPYTGSALSYINEAAKSTNVMLGLRRDGTIYAVVRESVTPSSVLTLSGVNAPVSWTKSTTIDVDVNRWVLIIDPATSPAPWAADAADVATYGRREYVAGVMTVDIAVANSAFADWVAYGGSQRPIVSEATMIVRAWTQDDLILLDPFQWVTESGTLWQVMSVRHSVTTGNDWRVTITADNLLDLL